MQSIMPEVKILSNILDDINDALEQLQKVENNISILQSEQGKELNIIITVVGVVANNTKNSILIDSSLSGGELVKLLQNRKILLNQKINQLKSNLKSKL